MKFIFSLFRDFIYKLKRKFELFKVNRHMGAMFSDEDMRKELKRAIQYAEDHRMHKYGLHPKTYMPISNSDTND